jgi:hypothetical protein
LKREAHIYNVTKQNQELKELLDIAAQDNPQLRELLDSKLGGKLECDTTDAE